jgi:Rps23 Pro-64 3,4-dihydroxylase Tpa1-like proline 4-hydroxylase
MKRLGAVVDVVRKVAPFAVVRDWLGQQTVARLLKFVQENEHLFDDSLVYTADGATVKRASRVSKSFGLGDNKGELKARLIALLPTVFDRFGMQQFVPSKIDTDLVVHGDGAYFLPHIDTNRGEGRLRILTAIYYFHSIPKGFSGGDLRLYSLDSREHVDVSPDCDTIVFFPSFFPHEVLPVRCPSQRFLDSRFNVSFLINRNE